eukprot:TRINITY_DN8746_c0_g1_i8.p1 TRINITY_DN8746_c0_g1~~TRINITY_DN8746_c0_g1_i8.p1  ORF type:complete len:396 (+),score=92.32 TRINITY_DN8746_c0_g1_i8:79-1266(+)
MVRPFQRVLAALKAYHVICLSVTRGSQTNALHEASTATSLRLSEILTLVALVHSPTLSHRIRRFTKTAQQKAVVGSESSVLEKEQVLRMMSLKVTNVISCVLSILPSKSNPTPLEFLMSDLAGPLSARLLRFVSRFSASSSSSSSTTTTPSSSTSTTSTSTFSASSSSHLSSELDSSADSDDSSAPLAGAELSSSSMLEIWRSNAQREAEQRQELAREWWSQIWSCAALYELIGGLLTSRFHMVQRIAPLLLHSLSAMLKFVMLSSSCDNLTARTHPDLYRLVTSFGEKEREALAICTDHVCRLYQQLARPFTRKYLTGSVMWALSDYIQSLSTFSIVNAPLVKRILRLGAFALLDALGETECTFIHQRLDRSGQVLFKALHADFIKHYKFDGKA